MQPRPAVAEILEPQRFERDVVGHAFEGEGLHDAGIGDLMEASAEPVRVTAALRDVAPLAAVPCVPCEDVRVHAVRAHPSREELRVRVGGQELTRRSGEVASDADDGQLLVGFDRGGGDASCGHERRPFRMARFGAPAFISASSESRRR